MKERPILFSGPMVRAILDGKKTQTRRVVKPDIRGEHDYIPRVPAKDGQPRTELRCPYGQPGERLWVRETFAIYGDQEKFVAHYRADRYNWPETGCAWKPSIHMPRWASRINLEITGVRVERLQEITNGDVRSEGFRVAGDPGDGPLFVATWNEFNEDRGFGWDSNPWVWVIEFKRDGTC